MIIHVERNNTNSQIKFKTSMLRLSLCDYSHPYILVKGTILIAAQAGDNPNNVNKKVVFKNCAPFIDWISEINNTQIDNAKYIVVIMLIYDIMEYSNIYSKTSGSLWQYYSDELALTNLAAIANFHGTDNSASCKLKQKITSLIGDNGTKNVKTMVPLKYLSNFWRTLEM